MIYAKSKICKGSCAAVVSDSLLKSQNLERKIGAIHRLSIGSEREDYSREKDIANKKRIVNSNLTNSSSASFGSTATRTIWGSLSDVS